MQKEIGSNFDLNLKKIMNDEPKSSIRLEKLKGSDMVFLSTGRGAEGFVLDAIQARIPEIKKIALVPPFTCDTVLVPFLERKYKIVTYPIKETLDIDIEKFEETLTISRAQVVLIHRYFGFNTLKGFDDIIEKYSQKGVVFIEDITQCLYSDFPVLASNYIIGSLRKWGPLPDGGYAVCREGSFYNKPCDYDEKLEKVKLDAAYLKYLYLHENKGNKQEFLDKFQAAEKILDNEIGFYKISPSAVKVQNGLELDKLKRKRRENYSYLYKRIKDLKFCHIITPKLKEDVVPLYFAIFVNERKELQEKLRDSCIYAPIVWPKPDNMPYICEEAEGLYDHILCLPIDQRYDLDDMGRMVSCLKEWGRTCIE